MVTPEEVGACPVCGAEEFEEDKTLGETVCRNCGAIIEEDMVEEEGGPRAFTQEEKNKIERTGAPLTFTKHDRGISTQMGSGGALRNVSPSKRGQYYRIRKWNRRLSGSKPRNLRYALSEIKTLVDLMNLPRSVHEESARLYEKSWEDEALKGRKIEKIVAGIVFLVSRMQGVPRTLKEVADASGVDKREVGKNYRYIARKLDKQVMPARPEEFVSRFAEELELPGEVQARAKNIIEEVREKEILSGRSPEGVVASALYIASKIEGEDRPQKDIAETVGVTEVTIRKGYKDFVEALGLEEEMEEAS
ncbi:MAG: transcription initiation factor IIB [Nanohaloarchaea archaeon]|nr:transcription initiation factor IIB [Candidatus Nanohaloarchaea archaeon]